MFGCHCIYKGLCTTWPYHPFLKDGIIVSLFSTFSRECNGEDNLILEIWWYLQSALTYIIFFQTLDIIREMEKSDIIMSTISNWKLNMKDQVVFLIFTSWASLETKCSASRSQVSSPLISLVLSPFLVCDISYTHPLYSREFHFREGSCRAIKQKPKQTCIVFFIFQPGFSAKQSLEQ